MSKSRKMKFENYENIHDDFFIICAFQNNLNGKHANICSDRRKETNENRINGHVQLIVVTFGDFQVTPVIHLVCLVALLDRLKIVPQITRVN